MPLDRIAGILQPGLLLLRSIGWLHLQERNAIGGAAGCEEAGPQGGARWPRGRRAPPKLQQEDQRVFRRPPTVATKPGTCWQGCWGRGAGQGPEGGSAARATEHPLVI